MAWAITRVLTTAATTPVEVPVTTLMTPCQIATSRMLPPLRLYTQVNTTAPQVKWYIDDRVREGARIPTNVWRDTFNGLITARAPTDAGTIAAPTFIIWGDRNELLTREQEEALAAAIPASRLVIYENTGHLVLWEQSERVASDLITFIESLQSGMPDER